MNIRFIFTAILCSLFLSSFAYAECSYTSRDSSCEVFTSPFNLFNLNFVDASDVESFDVSIYDSYNTKNLIKLDVDFDSKVVKNLNPFTKPGVYVLDVVVTNKVGKKSSFTKEYLFDNVKPNLPVIPVNLDSETTTVSVLGSALFAKEIIVADKFGTTIKKFPVLADGTFRLNLNLVNGVNFFKFASVGSNGLVSDFVERIIVSKSNSGINFKPVVSSVVLDNNDILNGIVSGVTLKRNIYVSGNIGASNSRVYISGNPVVSDEIGNFGGFVNLNQGDNTIVVLAGGKSKSFDVTYVSDEFSFTNFDVPKFTDASSVDIVVGAVYDLDFDVYLNGEFVSTQKTSSGTLNLKISNLRYGQNYIYLSGPLGKFVEKLVYFDNVKSDIVVVSPQISSKMENFIFEVSDEYGFDISKTVFKLNGVDVSNNDLEVLGNYFVYDVSNISFGDYSYSVLVYDLAGNFNEVFGSFKVAEDSVSIDDVVAVNGAVLGTRIFFNELGSQSLKLYPSKNIAFENIYLDGEDQTFYKINKDNSVDLEIRLSENSGEFEFVFIDNTNTKFTQKFSYVVIDKPKVELDFISRPILSEDETFIVSGRVKSSYFDWNSFKLNSDYGKRFGNYFENYVTFESSPKLIISGMDLMGNPLSYTFAGVGIDTVNLDLEFLDEDDSFFKGSISNFNPIMLGYTTSYDGIYSKQVLPQSFSLVSAQRSGLRNLNLNGVKESLKKFDYKDTISVDGLKPEIYFLDDRTVVLGTLSEVSEILINDVEIGVGDSCSSSEYFGSFCNEIDLFLAGDEITVIDSFGNEFSRTYYGSADDVSMDSNVSEIYFTGTDVFVDSRSTFVQGQYISDEEVTSIYTNYGDCSFDDYNFVCNVNLASGENFVDVRIVTKSGDVIGDDNNSCFWNGVQGSDMDSDNDGICDDEDSDDDGDGISDEDDSDDDNDGIPDEDDNDSGGEDTDGNKDSDNDGIPDEDDNDDDNDGIPDSEDSDDDGDGIPDEDDNDSGDGDGIIIVVIPGPEDPCTDCNDGDDDGDGIPNEDDDDSDNYIPIRLSLNDIYGDDVYEILNNYYFDSDKASFEGDVSKNALIKLVINNEEILVGEFDGRVNVIDVDLSDFVSGREEAQLDVKLRATDDFGRNKDSNVLILFYNRVLNTLIDIVIN
jgi:hypothetical protein